MDRTSASCASKPLPQRLSLPRSQTITEQWPLVAGDRLGGDLEEVRDQLGRLVRPGPVVVVEPAREADRRLLEHEHADLVADVEEMRARRIVRGPDDVDVGPAEVDDVGAHVLGGQRPALEDPGIVAIDAADPDRRSVDEQLVAAGLDPPEPDPAAIGLGGAALGGDHDLEVVRRGLFRGPGADGQRPRRERLAALAAPSIDPCRLERWTTSPASDMTVTSSS